MSFEKAGAVRVFLATLLMLFLSAPAGAAPVPDVCPSGCTYNSIQTAVSIAKPGTVIWVGNGTYYENIDFLSKAITVQSVYGSASTTIDGGGNGSVVTFNSGEGQDSVISGFTITNGMNTDGGGIYIDGSSPTITDCTITGNAADDDGGGIYVNGSSPTISGCTISSNTADNDGGGIYIYIASPTINNCIIEGNTAGTSGSVGGGISNDNSSLTITNCVISGNSSDTGGGIYNNSSLTATNCTISGNWSSFWAGGITNDYSSSATIANCTISGNYGSGTYNYIDSSAFIINSVIWGNSYGVAFDSSLDPSAVAVEYSNIQQEWPDIGNISLSPLFINQRPTSEAPTAEGNYHLRQGSPAIDSGTMGDASTHLIIPADDIDGDTRPQGAGYDMGSDEYKEGSGVYPVDDISIFRNGAWLFYDYSTGGEDSGVWTGSSPGCIPAPIDYDGDGAWEFSQFCNGSWHFYNDDGSYLKGIWTGGSGDLPVPADYDGDGTDDVVVFRDGAWLAYNFVNGQPLWSAWTGAPTHWTGGMPVPVPMDYDGDGTADLTVYSGGPWHFYNDNGSYKKGIWTGGVQGDIPVAADYNEDGVDEIVVFRTGAWLAYDFDTGLPSWSVWTGAPTHWNGGTSLPAPLDYDGDGAVDLTIYSGGPWHFYNFNGSYSKGVWTGGVAGDQPISRRLLP